MIRSPCRDEMWWMYILIECAFLKLTNKLNSFLVYYFFTKIYLKFVSHRHFWNRENPLWWFLDTTCFPNYDVTFTHFLFMFIYLELNWILWRNHLFLDQYVCLIWLQKAPTTVHQLYRHQPIDAIIIHSK